MIKQNTSKRKINFVFLRTLRAVTLNTTHLESSCFCKRVFSCTRTDTPRYKNHTRAQTYYPTRNYLSPTKNNSEQNFVSLRFSAMARCRFTTRCSCDKPHASESICPPTRFASRNSFAKATAYQYVVDKFLDSFELLYLQSYPLLLRQKECSAIGDAFSFKFD